MSKVEEDTGKKEEFVLIPAKTFEAIMDIIEDFLGLLRITLTASEKRQKGKENMADPDTTPEEPAGQEAAGLHETPIIPPTREAFKHSSSTLVNRVFMISTTLCLVGLAVLIMTRNPGAPQPAPATTSPAGTVAPEAEKAAASAAPERDAVRFQSDVEHPVTAAEAAADDLGKTVKALKTKLGTLTAEKFDEMVKGVREEGDRQVAIMQQAKEGVKAILIKRGWPIPADAPVVTPPAGSAAVAPPPAPDAAAKTDPPPASPAPPVPAKGAGTPTAPGTDTK